MLGTRIWRRWISIGIRREEKSIWESRSPLSPSHISQLIRRPNVNFVIQPSNTRVFTDTEYAMSGAKIDEDLRGCDLIIGVKEVPESQIIPRQSFMCFSHTHKGQKHNMNMLKKYMDNGCSLIDYELLTDESGRRLVAFGKFAGYAGMINCLHGVGLQLLQKGFRTPFLNIALSHTYISLEATRRNLRSVGEMIKRNRIPKAIQPLLFVFTGNGNVSQGAQEMAKELSMRFIEPSEIANLRDMPSDGSVYGCIIEAQDYCVHKESKPFTMEEYNNHPDRFTSVFYEKFAPYTTALINGIYWESKYPRLLSTNQAEALLGNEESKLVTIADISCDINGSIEFTHRASTIENPFYYFGAGKRRLQMMTIDNLPAQLPRDATDYFGDRLLPIIDEFIINGKEAPVIRRATIVDEGELASRHQWLQRTLRANKKSVLIIGSGYVAGPVIKHLSSRNDIEIVVGTNSIAEAQKLSSLASRPFGIELVDVRQNDKLEQLVSGADVVVSLVPATMHMPVAMACLKKEKHMVTASYISPSIQTIHEQVREKKLLFLNEIGLDPGLDHLSAKKIIDQVKLNGQVIQSFTSWCGGLPAPEAADNPLGYKFSWSPRGALLAALNDARYLENGSQINISGKDLLSSAKRNPFPSRFNLEGIPNRDSTKYISLYGLEGSVQTMLRGTLRYQGFCDLMRCFHALGLLSLDPLPSVLDNCKSWLEVCNIVFPLSSIEDKLQGINVSKEKLLEALEWLGILSPTESFEPSTSLLDSFCLLLQKKLQYNPSELDMVIMQHEFVVENVDRSIEYISSSLIEYGMPEGFSAMARTVGYPVAIATEMILDQQTNGLAGVLAPLSPKLYKPMLSRLDQVAGIRFKERKSRFRS